MRVLALGITLAAAAFFAIGCDPAFDITFENRTDGDIQVSARGNLGLGPFYDTVEARSSKTLSYLSRNVDAYRIYIADETGRLLLDDVYTIDELEARDSRFVVDEGGVLNR